MRSLTPMVYRLSVRMLGPGPEAEDACQEVFMRMHRSVASFDPTRPIEPWVARITYNTCLGRLGRVARRPDRATEPETLEQTARAIGLGPEATTLARESDQLVLAALERLSAQDRFLVELRYREDLTHPEIAESTGMPVGTIKTRLHRSRALLRKVLTPLFRERGGQR